MDHNPFEAIEAAHHPTMVEPIRYLRQTRPWLVFIALVCGFVGVLLLLIVVGVGPVHEPPEHMRAQSRFVLGIMAVGGVTSGIIGVSLVLQLIAIGRIVAGDGLPALAVLFRHQRDFWRLMVGGGLLLMIAYCGLSSLILG